MTTGVRVAGACWWVSILDSAEEVDGSSRGGRGNAYIEHHDGFACQCRMKFLGDRKAALKKEDKHMAGCRSFALVGPIVIFLRGRGEAPRHIIDSYR